MEYIRDGSVTALSEEETEKTLGLRSDLRLSNSEHTHVRYVSAQYSWCL